MALPEPLQASHELSISPPQHTRVLILDLDHTLVHGIFERRWHAWLEQTNQLDDELDPMAKPAKQAKQYQSLNPKQLENYANRHYLQVHPIDNCAIAIRPGAHAFLRQCSEQYGFWLIVCTKATPSYADEVMRLLDPGERWIRWRRKTVMVDTMAVDVTSQSTTTHTMPTQLYCAKGLKSIDDIRAQCLWPEYALEVLILDDSRAVWVYEDQPFVYQVSSFLYLPFLDAEMAWIKGSVLPVLPDTSQKPIQPAVAQSSPSPPSSLPPEPTTTPQTTQPTTSLTSQQPPQSQQSQQASQPSEMTDDNTPIHPLYLSTVNQRHYAQQTSAKSLVRLRREQRKGLFETASGLNKASDEASSNATANKRVRRDTESASKVHEDMVEVNDLGSVDDVSQALLRHSSRLSQYHSGCIWQYWNDLNDLYHMESDVLTDTSRAVLKRRLRQYARYWADLQIWVLSKEQQNTATGKTTLYMEVEFVPLHDLAALLFRLAWTPLAQIAMEREPHAKPMSEPAAPPIYIPQPTEDPKSSSSSLKPIPHDLNQEIEQGLRDLFGLCTAANDGSNHKAVHPPPDLASIEAYIEQCALGLASTTYAKSNGMSNDKCNEQSIDKPINAPLDRVASAVPSAVWRSKPVASKAWCDNQRPAVVERDNETYVDRVDLDQAEQMVG